MIILTGGAGFIGSCILSALNDRGREDVIVVDHFEPDSIKKKNLDGKKYYKYYDKGEFLQLVLDDQIKESVDCVIHMGACSSTTLDDKAYYQKNNFEYSCHLAKWALKHQSRFIYASSAATYGDGELGYSDDDETSLKCQPLNYYGESKQNFDEWVLANDLIGKVVGLKFFNVFGPNEYHKEDMRSLICKAYPRVVKEGKMCLFKSYHEDYADGEQRRDFIYVKDTVDIVFHFHANPDINGIFNVGTGASRSWNDLAHALFKAVGKEPVIEYIDMPEYIRPRYQYFTEAIVSKLRNSGYDKPFTTLEDAIKDYEKYLRTESFL